MNDGVPMDSQPAAAQLRKLGSFERALYLSDQHEPFNVVVVLRLENAPAPETWRTAFEMLQVRHPLLRAAIRNGSFVTLPALPDRWQVLDRKHDNQWKEVVEWELNTRLDTANGLSRAYYLYSGGDPTARTAAELVLTFHHSIMDAVSGINLLDELLQASSGRRDLPPLPLVPPVEERFPPAFKGLRGMAPMLKYAGAQVGDELGYAWRSRGKRAPHVQPGGRSFIATMVLPEALVTALSQRSRKQKVTLNSLLNAAQLLAVNRRLYAGQPTPMRTFTFADLRPYGVPPTPPENLANYISMMRFTVDVTGNEDIWLLARRLHQKIYPALKRGDKFIAARMSESMMKILLATRSIRMGAAGLNYSGAVPIQPEYGDIRVVGLHGFLSCVDLGPQASSQARLFQDELWWDFMFLSSDMSREEGERIMREVRSILEGAV